MRILHTSDWHLGRSFHKVGLLAAQATFVDHLVEAVRSESVDLVVVAGDVYDRALPPVDAVTLAGEALQRLADLRVPTVITSGNHDSARRLGFAADLIAAAGIHLRTDADAVGAPVLLSDAHGDVAVYGLPYLEPETLHERWGLPGRTHQAAMSEGVRRVRDDLGRRTTPTRSVLVAHAWVTGASPSDSERDITVGGAAQVRADTFDGIDYVALGHLHGAQEVRPQVRYSGSPLAYSFSEAHHLKGSWLVDLGPAGVTSTEFVAAPVPRRLALLTGRLDELLHGAAYSQYEHCWCQVTLTDPVRPRAAMERLRQRFPETLVLVFAPEGAPTGDHLWARTIHDRSDLEVVTRFVDVVRGGAADADEHRLLQAACESCRTDVPGEAAG
ncbi:MAG: exonuclease SbcCD subunit D [Nocardioidaceae bacterium]